MDMQHTLLDDHSLKGKHNLIEKVEQEQYIAVCTTLPPFMVDAQDNLCGLNFQLPSSAVVCVAIPHYSCCFRELEE